LVHKLGQIVWKGFTKPYKRNQETSYHYDKRNNKYITREEQLVRDTWKNDQLAHREIKNSRNKECLVAGTALEVNALQAYAVRTVMRKSGDATASVSPTEFDMQTYQESLLTYSTKKHKRIWTMRMTMTTMMTTMKERTTMTMKERTTITMMGRTKRTETETR